MDVVIGGGIDGAASALASRGATVALIGRGDFAAATSQASSNLAWGGGIKYLEQRELGLVHDLCRARNELLRSYPASVQEIRFHVAHPRAFRHPRWALLAGTWLYWAVGHFFTRRPRLVSLSEMEREEPIIDPTGVDGGIAEVVAPRRRGAQVHDRLIRGQPGADLVLV